MKLSHYSLSGILLICLFFASALTAKASGGIGISPAEVDIAILEGDKAKITFHFSREFVDTVEQFNVLIDNADGISLPDGQIIIMAPGERSKDVKLVIDASKLSIGEYDTRVNFQTIVDAGNGVGLSVNMAVSAILQWRILDVNGYTDFLLTNKPIEFTNVIASKNIADGERFSIDFLSQNNSLSYIGPLSYRVEIVNANGDLSSSRLIEENVELGPYGEKQFNVIFRASKPGENRAVVKAIYNEIVIAEQEITYVVRPRGIDEYLIISLHVIIILFVLFVMSVSRKKKLLP